MTFFPPAHVAPTGSMAGQWQPGIVIDNNDPTKQQRVRVRLSQFHLGVNDKDLPWCRQFCLAVQGNSPGIGSVGIPVIGAKVFVHFPEDDPHNAMYLGADNASNTILAELTSNYPNQYGTIDAANNLFVVDTQAKTWTMYLSQGTNIKIDSSGFSLAVNGTMKMHATGDIDIHAGGTCNIDATMINLNGGSNPASSLPTTARPAIPAVDVSNKTDY